ncbi:HEAT repeat domain-containing protein [Coleofasciculus sp. G2-EDA-02]|uniref:HEAT repeat domain-containing protein n=1 Tax=Coleofasciculus sp. G2-EDA-02 TaxID=3069529 RepID=UPI0032F51CEB
MEKLLKQATVATEQGDWFSVTQCLQQLPLHECSYNSSNPETKELPLGLAIALTVLEQGDFQARWDIAKVLPQWGERIVAPLVQILEDEEKDLEQRWFAGRILGGFNTPEVIRTLVKLLDHSEDEELSAIAASALAAIGQPAVEALTDLLVQPEFRLFATRALAQMRCLEVIDPLLSVVHDPDVQVRLTAIAALSSFHDDRIVPVFQVALKDYAASVRKEAVMGLGLSASCETELEMVKHLQPLLYDVNLEVCEQAAIAIGRIGTDKAAEALFPVVRSPLTPLPLQMTVIQVLARIETATTLEYLHQALPAIAEDSILEIVRVFGRIETPNLKYQAAKILLDFFKSGHPSVETTAIKQALAYSWGQLGVADAMKALVQLQNDPQLSVKLHANAAIKQLQ